MPTMLSPNFSAEELSVKWNGDESGPVPSSVLPLLAKLAGQLQQFRDAIGAPFRVTSGYRSAGHNAVVPGSSETSDHVNGRAADGYFVGPSMWQVYSKVRTLQKASAMMAFDQLIFYPQTTGHIHIGFGPRMRGQVLVKLKDGKYYQVVSELESLLPGYAQGDPRGLLSVPQTPPIPYLPAGTGAGEDAPSTSGQPNVLLWVAGGVLVAGAVLGAIFGKGGLTWR